MCAQLLGLGFLACPQESSGSPVGLELSGLVVGLQLLRAGAGVGGHVFDGGRGPVWTLWVGVGGHMFDGALRGGRCEPASLGLSCS